MQEFQVVIYFFIGMMVLSVLTILTINWWEDIYKSILDFANFLIDAMNWVISTFQSLIGWNFYLAGNIFKLICEFQQSLYEFSISTAEAFQIDMVGEDVD